MAWYMDDDDFFLPPQCTLPFEEQVRNLSTAFAATDFLRKHPLLPPYTMLEVLAMEVKYQITFPEILRFYMLNISRETCFDFGRAIIAPYFLRLDSPFRPSKESWLAFQQSTCAGEEFVIPLSGRGKGYLFLSYGIWFTLYDILAQGPFEDDDDYDEKLTFEQLYHTIASDEIKQAGLPDDLRMFKCELGRDAERTLLIYAMLTRCVEETLGVPARKIQRQFRLWRWRLKNIFNPHTVLGQYNLRIKAKALINS